VQLLHPGADGRVQHLLALAQNALRQQVLKGFQAAGLQQFCVLVDFGNQAFLRRQWQHALRGQAQ